MAIAPEISLQFEMSFRLTPGEIGRGGPPIGLESKERRTD
jgi:hypothetical protein